jgi:CRP-like cAMP-binding protein
MEKISFLKTITAFKNLALSKLKLVIDQFSPIMKIRGSYLFREGEPVKNIYLVMSGEFKVLKKVFHK